MKSRSSWVLGSLWVLGISVGFEGLSLLRSVGFETRNIAVIAIWGDDDPENICGTVGVGGSSAEWRTFSVGLRGLLWVAGLVEISVAQSPPWELGSQHHHI